jgi:hypothetical protein
MKPRVNSKRAIAIVWLMAVFLSAGWAESHTPSVFFLFYQDDGFAPA